MATLTPLSPSMLDALVGLGADSKVTPSSQIGRGLLARGMISKSGKVTPLGQQVAGFTKANVAAKRELQNALNITKSVKVREVIEDAVALLDGDITA